MGVFHSWSRTWIFEIGIGDLPMCCQSAEYSEPLKNLDRLACTKAFPQTPSPVFTAIHPINTTGLFNYRIRKLLVVWHHYYSLLSFLFSRVCSQYISGSHNFLNTPLSLSQTFKTSSRQYKNKSSVSPWNHQKPSKSQQHPHAPHALIYHYSNIPFTGWIGQRHLNVISGSCSPNVDYKMLLLCSGI